MIEATGPSGGAGLSSDWVFFCLQQSTRTACTAQARVAVVLGTNVPAKMCGIGTRDAVLGVHTAGRLPA